MNSLAGLFPRGEFRHHLTLRRGDPSQFFSRQDPAGSVLAERRRWLGESPARYAGSSEQGNVLVNEFAQLCTTWGLITAERPRAGSFDAAAESDLVALGSALEPDLLLLSPDEAGAFRLQAGVLCFPTGWALDEKLGHTLDFIHGVVPGLNAALSSPINQFLTKLKPGVAFLRDNWGIAASSELNLHPARAIAAPGLPVRLSELWLRVEHQALFALPSSVGVVFAIRISLHRLDQAVTQPGIAAGLAAALATMPEALIAYKRLHVVKDRLGHVLGEVVSLMQ
jgi:hypothetical protein